MAGYVGDQPVRDWAEDGVSPIDLDEDHILDRVDVGEVQADGKVSVTAVAEVRWREFDLPVSWHTATGEHLRAVEDVFRKLYGADDFGYRDEGDDDAYLTVEWTVEVDGTTTLADAVTQIYARQPEGPAGLHNALNGGYLSRNAYADVRAAVAGIES